MSLAVRFHSHGGPEVLQLEEVDVPPPASGEARVRHTAVGVNFIDTYHRSGLYPVPLPSGVGTEAIGVVEALGPGTETPAVGTRVGYVSSTPGCYAAVRNVAAERLVNLPNAVDDLAGAALLLKGMTVEYLVQRTFAVQPGDTVLWHAAAGGVGLVACQWLAALGAVVIGTVSSEEKAEIAQAHGCRHTILYGREPVAERVRELTGGQGVPVAYDSVGRDTFASSLQSLRPRGLLISFGNASGPPPPLDVLELSRRGSLFVTRPTLFHYTATRTELEASAAALFERVASGTIRAHIHATWPLGEARAAHETLESRATRGACVLLP
jgi:NADPH2:quinone reductase